MRIGPRTFFANIRRRPASPNKGWPIRPGRPREEKLNFTLANVFRGGMARKVRDSQFSNQPLDSGRLTATPAQGLRDLERIGIDARFFGPRQKGLGRYVQKLVEELEQLLSRSPSAGPGNNFLLPKPGPQPESKAYEFIIFLRRENWSEYQPTNPNFKKVLADYKWYSWSEQIFLPWKIWQEKIDLMHFPHFNLPIFCPTKFIVTIHDLVLKKFPTRRASALGPLCYWLKNLAYRLVIWLAIKRAKKIIAVSNYTKEDILRYFKVKPEKIEVIYEAGLEVKMSNTRCPTPNKCPMLKFKISKPYLLYVGNAYPHKNLERLILAFQRLIENYQMNYQLVLVGQIDYFYKRLQKNISSFQKIIFTDFVSDQELDNLYRNAALYVFPSLGEGFGLPPLEAMARRLPVVCSQATCLPEILGPAAVYFNPLDINEIAEKIKLVLEDKSLQEDLIKKGLEQIKKYNWSKMAKETLETYQTVI